MDEEQQRRYGVRVDEDKSRQLVTALARGLEVLRCFRPGENYLGNHQIAERTGLPKATVSRLTFTLTQLGYLLYSETEGKYRLGTGVMALSYAFLSSMDIRERARPLMQEVADHSKVSVALGTRDRLDMVYIERCRGAAAVTLLLDIGSRLPIGTSAMGRAYLAALPVRERENLLYMMRETDPQGFPIIRSGVEDAMAQIAERGFYASFSDWTEGVNAVGVPIILADGTTRMALNCGGPHFLLSRDFLEQDVGPRLVRVANELSAAPPQELVRLSR